MGREGERGGRDLGGDRAVGDGVVLQIRPTRNRRHRHRLRQDRAGSDGIPQHILGVEAAGRREEGDVIASHHAAGLQSGGRHSRGADGGCGGAVIGLVGRRDAGDGERLGRDGGGGVEVVDDQPVIAGISAQEPGASRLQNHLHIHGFASTCILIGEGGGAECPDVTGVVAHIITNDRAAIAGGTGGKRHSVAQPDRADRDGGGCGAVVDLVVGGDARGDQSLDEDSCRRGGVSKGVVGGIGPRGRIGNGDVFGNSGVFIGEHRRRGDRQLITRDEAEQGQRTGIDGCRRGAVVGLGQGRHAGWCDLLRRDLNRTGHIGEDVVAGLASGGTAEGIDHNTVADPGGRGRTRDADRRHISGQNAAEGVAGGLGQAVVGLAADIARHRGRQRGDRQAAIGVGEDVVSEIRASAGNGHQVVAVHPYIGAAGQAGEADAVASLHTHGHGLAIDLNAAVVGLG